MRPIRRLFWHKIFLRSVWILHLLLSRKQLHNRSCSREYGANNCYQMSLSKGGERRAGWGMGWAMVGAAPLYITSPSSSCGVLSSPVKEATCWAGSGLSLRPPEAIAESRSWPRPSSSRSTQWGCRWWASSGATPWKDFGCRGDLSLSAKAKADIQRTHWAMSCHL